MRLIPVVAILVVSAALCSSPASASQILDRNITNVRLAVNAKGEALVTYTRANGQSHHVLAWGAVDAVAPDPNVAQQRFNLDYAGGWTSTTTGVTGAPSRTSVARTEARRLRTWSPRARPRMARTGLYRAGSAFSR
jgi:hypothetical protein